MKKIRKMENIGACRKQQLNITLALGFGNHFFLQQNVIFFYDIMYPQYPQDAKQATLY
jgi:hypothetical protein